jgi:hypothetical protein
LAQLGVAAEDEEGARVRRLGVGEEEGGRRRMEPTVDGGVGDRRGVVRHDGAYLLDRGHARGSGRVGLLELWKLNRVDGQRGHLGQDWETKRRCH